MAQHQLKSLSTRPLCPLPLKASPKWAQVLEEDQLSAEIAITAGNWPKWQEGTHGVEWIGAGGKKEVPLDIWDDQKGIPQGTSLNSSSGDKKPINWPINCSPQ